MSIKNSNPLKSLSVRVCLLTVFSLLLTAYGVSASGTISGAVYVDYNMNGVRNTTGTAPDYAIDGGLSGVTVTVYAPNGANKTATTAANGSYSINTSAGTPLPAGPYRVEYTNLPAGYFPSAAGTNNATSVRFVAEGGAANVDFGVIAPKEFCQTTPWLVTNSYVVGPGTYPSLVAFPYRYADELDGNVNGTWSAPPSRTSALAPTAIGDADTVGATFGLAWNNLTNRVFAGSYLKRGARFGGLGAESTGAIYQIDNPLAAAPAISVFVDLNAVFGAGTAGANPHPASNTDFGTDPTAIDQIGKVSLGGLKLSKDGTKLYAVNLADRRLYVMPTSGALNSSTITRFNIPTTGLATSSGNCATADVRPFALGRDRAGQIYVGGVCSAESETSDAKLTAYVWRFDNPGFTLVATNSLTFGRVLSTTESTVWQRWANDTGVLNRAAPVLTDIEFDGSDMILGVRDRYGDQVVTPNYYRGYGDLMRACPNGATFNFESNGGCGSLTTTGAGTGAGPGGGEYYIDLNGDGREEGALGGLVQVPGFNHVVATFYDAVAYNSAGTRVSNFYTAGVQRYNNTTGAMTGAYDVYLQSDSGTFGKADGVGDTEVLCEAAPLQIGNRVWTDANANGIQDASETGIANVAVQLWADTNSDNAVDTQVGAATTDASGNYIFGGTGNANLGTYACGTATSDTRVAVSADDAEQNAGNGSVSINNSDLELTADGNTQQYVGVRFTGVGVPKNASVTSAYLEFTPRDDGQTVNTGNPTITIRAQDADNAATFTTTANDVSSRPTTAASATWSPGSWTVGTAAQTTDVTALVQAVVNRTGWTNGNAMAFVLSGAAANNFRRAWSFDGGGGSAKAPRLVVQYTTFCNYAVNPQTKYEVRLPASNFTTGQALFGKTPSPRDTDASANGDSRDSDGVPGGGQVTAALVTGNNGENNHTYDFGFYVAPTAANAGIGGAVYDGGRGLGRVTVTLSGGGLKQPRVTQTSAFGYYHFDDLPAGETYVVTVVSKKYYFPNPSLVVNLTDNISDANFETGAEILSPVKNPMLK
ncbi:MAG: hypothetical protein JSS81_12625 [Acidobacteria bacterium]|nr:hypothetical protein [Acidobacteriota bacterium]